MTANAINSILPAAALASGIVTAQQLDYCSRVARYRQSQKGIDSNSPIPDPLLAEILVEQNILTEYQVNQLSQGRTKLNLGPYIILDWIGQGGMGQVFKAVHQVMGRECAVKVLPKSRATDESRDSFAREIRMQAKLDCPYLVRAFDAGLDGNVHYLVTEYVPGMDLRRLVKQRGPLPLQQAAQIIMQAALGLDYAHREGMVHRDVKPGNILVTPDGDAKVSDVGLAGFAKDLINDPRAGKIVGTTDYLSPEQIRTPLDIRPASDIYSLGCTLYYAVCGKVPFPGGDTESKLRRHLVEYPLHPRNFVADITEDFADIIVDMTEKDLSKRIASAAEVAARLEPWASEAESVGTVSLSRSPWLAPPPPQHQASEDDTSGDVASTDAGSGEASSGARPSGGAVAGDALGGGGNQSGESGIIDSGLFGSDATDPSVPAGSAGLQSSAFATPFSAELSSESALGKRHTGRESQAPMIIALTIAIIVPPSLLVGAIIGYLIRGG